MEVILIRIIVVGKYPTFHLQIAHNMKINAWLRLFARLMRILRQNYNYNTYAFNNTNVTLKTGLSIEIENCEPWEELK